MGEELKTPGQIGAAVPVTAEELARVMYDAGTAEVERLYPGTGGMTAVTWDQVTTAWPGSHAMWLTAARAAIERLGHAPADAAFWRGQRDAYASNAEAWIETARGLQGWLERIRDLDWGVNCATARGLAREALTLLDGTELDKRGGDDPAGDDFTADPKHDPHVEWLAGDDSAADAQVRADDRRAP